MSFEKCTKINPITGLFDYRLDRIDVNIQPVGEATIRFMFKKHYQYGNFKIIYNTRFTFVYAQKATI